MSNQKLIRVKNGDQSTSYFTTDFNPPILVPEKSSIALQNLSMKLRPNLVNIDDTVNQFSYATVKTTAGTYNQLIAEHKSTLANKVYTISELIETINVSANSKLFYSSSANHTKEQGAEILFNIDSLTNKTAFHYVARAESEFCAPVPTAVATNGYTYTTALVNNLYTVGNIERGQPVVTTFDTYFTTTNVFCRGSGEIRFTDGSSVYQYTGTWTNGNTFTTDNDITVVESGLEVGEIINFETAGNKEVQTLAQGGTGAQLVIVMTSGGVANGADILRDASLTAGYMVGLIESNELKLTTADEILSRVTYGVMVLNKENTYGTYDPGVYYVKKGKNSPWESTNLLANNQPTIKMQLGRHESPNDQYKIRIIETYGNNQSRPIADFDYTYGNYVMLTGIMKDTSKLSEIRWTESKITKGSSDDGYYSTYAPDLSLRENNFVDVANAQPDENVQYFGNSDGYAVLDWLNLETASVYGYYQQQNTSSNIKNSSTLTVIIPANLAINAQYGFPESVVCKLQDLPLESYDNGKEEHIIAFIPNIVVNDKSLLVYTPSPPIYINLKNASPMYLDHLTVRLENEDNTLLDNQETCSIVLLIASK